MGFRFRIRRRAVPPPPPPPPPTVLESVTATLRSSPVLTVVAVLVAIKLLMVAWEFVQENQFLVGMGAVALLFVYLCWNGSFGGQVEVRAPQGVRHRFAFGSELAREHLDRYRNECDDDDEYGIRIRCAGGYGY